MTIMVLTTVTTMTESTTMTHATDYPESPGIKRTREGFQVYHDI
ncbi:MAG: hypothetical protein ABGY11_09345 [Candidatus Thioglobus sp.]